MTRDTYTKAAQLVVASGGRLTMEAAEAAVRNQAGCTGACVDTCECSCSHMSLRDCHPPAQSLWRRAIAWLLIPNP